MARPSLTELPPPPDGKVGWPWTDDGSRFAHAAVGLAAMPLVSIVTPSLNQSEFLEETIRSVLLQDYPHREYTVLDGGSTDGSVDIIRRYEPWLARWASEPDRGQADAVQRGWKPSSGQVLAYLNSDDTYLPQAISRAVAALHEHPQAPAVTGGELRIDREGRVLKAREASATSLVDLLHLHFISQPATFVRRHSAEQAGWLDISYECAFDFELWTRVSALGVIEAVPYVLATTRWYGETKTRSRRSQIADELIRCVEQRLGETADLGAGEQRAILAELHTLAFSIYLEHPRFVGKALSSWSRALRQEPGRWGRLLRLMAGKAGWHVRRAVRFAPAERGPERLPHWTEWMADASGRGVL